MPVFESTSDDVLGLWTTLPGSAPVSFGIGDAESPDFEVYRTNLPADPAEARQILQDGKAMLGRMDAALEVIPSRLDGLVTRTQTRQAAGVSFGLEPQALEPGPEGELLAMLAEADRGAQGTVSFGFGDLASQAWETAKAKLNALTAQIDRDVLHFAWVETSISSTLIARSTINWTGDLETQWQTEVTPDESRLHENSLETAARTRHLRLRLFVTVATGSIKVAGLMVSPGGAVLALPAVFQYVTKIVAQARELQSIQTPQGA